MAKPIIRSFHPNKIPEQRPAQLIIYGENFELTATVTVGGIAPTTTTNVSSTEIKLALPNTITAGDQPIIVTNPSDGKKSDPIPFTFFSEVSIGGRRRSNPLADQKNQPLAVSFKGRTDVQRIAATSGPGPQFTGTIPEYSDDTAGDRGGLWQYQDAVWITHIGFNSAAAESRSAPSGIYLVDRQGHETKLLDLEASLANVALTDPFLLAKGEYIKCVTTDATEVMTAKVTHHAYNRRNR